MLRRAALLAMLIFVGELIAFAQDLRQAAQEAVRNHRFAQARHIYQELFKGEPSNLEYLIWIARLSGWLGDYQQAVEEYNDVLSREPTNADAIIGKAYVLMWQGRLTDARLLLERARAIAPNDSDITEAWKAYARYA